MKRANLQDHAAPSPSSPGQPLWRPDGVWMCSTSRQPKRSNAKRQIANEAAFVPSQASAGIDLLMSYARQGNPGRAEPLLREVEEAVVSARGWHEWLFRMRLEHARAELALARCDWPTAITCATSVLKQSQAGGRVKYEAAALAVRAQSLQA